MWECNRKSRLDYMECTTAILQYPQEHILLNLKASGESGSRMTYIVSSNSISSSSHGESGLNRRHKQFQHSHNAVRRMVNNRGRAIRYRRETSVIGAHDMNSLMIDLRLTKRCLPNQSTRERYDIVSTSMVHETRSAS